jgi:hypothetical protein
VIPAGSGFHLVVTIAALVSMCRGVPPISFVPRARLEHTRDAPSICTFSNFRSMANTLPNDNAHGWLFRAVPRNSPWPPRYFVAGSSVQEDALQLVQSHPDVGDDTIEAVGRVSAANMIEFEVDVGEAKQIDAPTFIRPRDIL